MLHDVNLDLGAGLHILLGPNGAGKTTLFRVLSGVLEPSSGEVLVGGTDPFTEISAKTRVGVAAHRAALAGRLSVADNLEYWGRVLGLSGAGRKDAVERTIGLLNLGKIAAQRAGTLSRGQAQRVNLAKAMLSDPDVLLLDEPFSGVDPETVAELRDRFREWAAAGRTLLASTHELAEASEIGDDVTVLRAGTVIGRGTAAELRSLFVGSGYKLRIKATGDLSGALTRLNYHAEPASGGAIVAVADEAAAEKLLTDLARAGIGIREAAPAANPLEDIYLHMQKETADGS